jgi:hypothetical protein
MMCELKSTGYNVVVGGKAFNDDSTFMFQVESERIRYSIEGSH